MKINKPVKTAMLLIAFAVCLNAAVNHLDVVGNVIARFFGLIAPVLAGFLLAFCSFLFLLILDNAFSRLTSYWMLRYMWTVPLTLALANLIWLWR